MSLRALLGGELKGDKLVRFAYLDEAGISSFKHEPVAVVAGVIVHADRQWRSLYEHFEDLQNRFVPEENRDGFVFHAKDIWHGNGVFDRDKWKGDRREVLRELCNTVRKFQLPVIYGLSHKPKVLDALSNVDEHSQEVTWVSYMAAFADCAISAEKWMRKYAEHEVISLILENNAQLKKYAHALHKELIKKSPIAELCYVKEIPFTKIIDAPSFMEKDDAPPLQLADLCAFLIKRWASGKQDVTEYINILAPSMYEIMERLSALDDSKRA